MLQCKHLHIIIITRQKKAGHAILKIQHEPGELNREVSYPNGHERLLIKPPVSSTGWAVIHSQNRTYQGFIYKKIQIVQFFYHLKIMFHEYDKATQKSCYKQCL